MFNPEQTIADVKNIITEAGGDPAKFEIEAKDLGDKWPYIRVAVYTERGGFMSKVFGDKQYENLRVQTQELFG